MNSRFAASRQTPSDKAVGIALFALWLAASAAAFRLLPWPEWLDSGWLAALIVLIAGFSLSRVAAGRWWPDLNEVRASAWFYAGAAFAQAALHAIGVAGL